MTLLKILVSFLIVLFYSSCYSQESAVSAGEDITGGTGSINFSIGQVFFMVAKDSKNSIYDGIQQAYEISTVTEIETPLINVHKCIVYPNPTTDYIILETELLMEVNLKFQLLSITGNILLEEKMNSNLQYINMTEYSPSTYILRVFTEKAMIKSFKIIKN